MVVDALRRDRFITIMRFLHYNNNADVNANDKLWKLRPSIDLVKANIKCYCVLMEQDNFDESMMKYYFQNKISSINFTLRIYLQVSIF